MSLNSNNIKSMPIPYYRGGRKNKPELIIIHYTAGQSIQSLYKVLNARELSVHNSVDRDGMIYEHVSDNYIAFHAGRGQWLGSGYLNSRSLGIEVINFGWGFEGDGKPSRYNSYGPPSDELEKDSGGIWHRLESYNRNGEKIYTRVLTKQKMSKFPDHRKNCSHYMWSLYTDKQVDSTNKLIWSWIKTHKSILIENIVGHEHVSPERKLDPGPAWPWEKTANYMESMARKEMPELLDPNYKRRDRVKAVQSHVERCGYEIGEIDGVWGKLTERGVRELVDKFNDFYSLSLSKDDIDPDNTLKLCRAFRKIPGFPS